MDSEIGHMLVAAYENNLWHLEEEYWPVIANHFVCHILPFASSVFASLFHLPLVRLSVDESLVMDVLKN